MRELKTETLTGPTMADVKSRAFVLAGEIEDRGDTFVRVEVVKTQSGFAVHVDWTQGEIGD